MEKNELFLKRGWRYSMLPDRHEGILVWNSQKEELYKLPPFVFDKLVERDLYGMDSLDEAIKQVTKEKSWSRPVFQNNPFPYQGCFTMLGYRVLIRCKYKKCLQGVRDYFSHRMEESACSPDVIVDCTWKKADTRLFTDRAVSGPADPLKGVWVHCFGEMATEEWPYASPPVPPLCVRPFKDQFVGLHAALLMTPAGKGLMIVGASGAGKTTCSIELAHNHGCSFMTDELVLVHKRTVLAEPFSRPLGIKQAAGTGKKSVCAATLFTHITSKAALITHIVLLDPGSSGEGWFERVTEYELLMQLLKQHQDAGCNNDEAVVTLMQLAGTIPAARFGYQHYDELISGCRHFIDFTTRTH